MLFVLFDVAKVRQFFDIIENNVLKNVNFNEKYRKPIFYII